MAIATLEKTPAEVEGNKSPETFIVAGESHAPPRLVPRALVISAVGSFILLFCGALYYARGFFLPLVLALLITLTFSPITRSLARRGIPAVVSAILLVAAMAGVAGIATLLLAEPVTNMVAAAPEVAQDLKKRFGGLDGPIGRLVRASEEVQAITEPNNGPAAPQKVVVAQPGILSWAADTLSGMGTTIGATLVFVVFLLSSSDLFLHKIVRAVPTLHDKKRSLRIVHDVENEVSRYLLTISVINILFGCAVGIAMALLGMPNPLVWGVAAALLNYIPYLGAIIGIGLSAAVSLVTFPSFGMALLPPLAYFALHLLEGSVITPLTLGRRLELNAVAILVALAFGSWMWGVVGALIAVPVLVVVKVFCDHLPTLATFGEFLSGEPAKGDE